MITILKMDTIDPKQLFARDQKTQDVSEAVREIIAQVRKRGDAALLEYAERFDKVTLSSLQVTPQEMEAAVSSLEPEFLAVLEEAKENIWAYHQKQKLDSFVMSQKPGVVLGQKVVPLEKVGIYVPGGTAAYPSSVLMNAIPAKIAGVKELVMVTPPSRDGGVNPGILAAAKVAGVSKIFKVGGAQAVAALAYGTETIPGVDKITGPGNAYVAEAKRQVFGQVAIDMIAGPSEILVVADETSNPAFVAADMLSQAEHDTMASAVLVTDSMDLAQKVAQEIEKQLSLLERREIAQRSIEQNGKIIVTKSLAQAMEAANEIAPEHLEICTEEPFAYLSQVRNAGSVFLGRYNPEPLGDYFAGPNHTLPTMGTARFYSPLSVHDFLKKIQFSYYTKEALEKEYPKVSLFARKEGLGGHANAVEIRFREK